MKLSELFGKAGLSYSPALGEIEICNIATDSRKVEKGSLFVCIRGLHFDGHDGIEEAMDKGAAVIVAEQVRDVFVGGAAIVEVENTRSTLALLYDAWYGCPSQKLRIVGVTGTNGKTSVTWMLHDVFSRLGFRCGMIGTVDCLSGREQLPKHSGGVLANLTTPDPEELYAMLARMVEDRVDFVFMEVTSHALALGKCDAILFDTAVFTNLTQDHLDFHKNMEDYRKAKEKLFTMCRRAVLNVDDSVGRQIFERMKTCAVSCSCYGDATYTARNIKNEGVGVLSYRLGTPTGSCPVFLPLPGEFFVINSLQVAAVAAEYGITAERVSFALQTMQAIPGRMERVTLEARVPFSVWIDYAHTPDALEKVLHSLRRASDGEGKLILVFGCGGERDRSKRKEMAIIASRLADFVIITSDNSRGENPEQIFHDILCGIDKEKPFLLIRDRKDAIAYAVGHASAKDKILLAGKGHERYEIDATGRHPFDEREIVKTAVARSIWNGGQTKER